MIASQRDSCKILSAVADYDHELNAKDDSGSTALMLAVKLHSLCAVSELLRRGADSAVKDKEGFSVLDHARSSRDEDLIRLLAGPVDGRAQEAFAQAKKAAGGGDFAQAFALYWRGFRELGENAPYFPRLVSPAHEGILAAAAHMGESPPTSEDARKHLITAMTLVKDAGDSDVYRRAQQEIEQAILAAPWWATAYYDLAKVQESNHQFGAAAENLKLYLIGRPGAEDARMVQDHIYTLETKEKESAR